MIIEFLLSVLILLIASVFGTLVSGGAVFDMVFFPSDMFLLFLLVLILAGFIFISGYGKAFIKLFSTRKYFDTLELDTLKTIEKSITYASKAAVYEAVFFVCIGTVYYYVNWMNIQTLGFQLSLMILSARYICSIEVILFCLKGNLRKQIIVFMSENENELDNQKKSIKENLISLLKTVLFLVLIIAITVLIIQNYTRNESDVNFALISTWIDLPSIIFILIPVLLLLLSNGLFKDFFTGISSSFSGRKIHISEKNQLVNAISTVRCLILLLGLIMLLLGYYAVLTYLENKASLGANMMIATIPCFYAVIINLVLLSAEAGLDRLSE